MIQQLSLRKETVRNGSGFGLIPKKKRKLGDLTHNLDGFAKCWFLQASICAPLHCKKKHRVSQSVSKLLTELLLLFLISLSVRCSNLSGDPHSREHVIVQFLNRNVIITSTQIPNTESSLMNPPHKVI